MPDCKQPDKVFVEDEDSTGVPVLLADTKGADIYPVERFSSWQRLLRVTAYILRLSRNVRSKKSGQQKRTGPLLATEVLDSKERLIRIAQSSVSDQLEGKPRSQIVQQLGLVRDEKGHIRCSGKLDYSDLPDPAKFPLRIPKNSPISRLLIDDVHRRLMHAGPMHMIAELRQEY